MGADVVDVEGAMRAWINAYPGLCGRGNPLTNGVHIADVRSPSSGAIAQQTLTPGGRIDDITHTARMSWEIRAVGSEEGARLAAGRAARALAQALLTLSGAAVTVTTKAGELVRILVVDNVQGPAMSGESGGQVRYAVDATVVAQPGAEPVAPLPAAAVRATAAIGATVTVTVDARESTVRTAGAVAVAGASVTVTVGAWGGAAAVGGAACVGAAVTATTGIVAAQVVGHVRFTTTGATFAPVVELASGSTATVTWTVEDSALEATGLTPTLDFGSSATRYVRMTVTATDGSDAAAEVTTVNLGYNHDDDAGRYVMGVGYDHPAQAVTAVEHLTTLTGIIRFAAAGTDLAGTLDFTGCADLEFVEVFRADVASCVLTGCTGLVRLCVEQNNITGPLDLNPVAACLRDLRAASQQGGTLTLTTLTADLTQLYHLCVAHQTVVGMPAASRLPAVEERWIGDTGLSGVLTSASTAIKTLFAYDNPSITSVDLGGQFPAGRYGAADLHGCSITSVTLTGCPGLTTIDLSDNALGMGSVDGVLVLVESWGTSNGTIYLSSNTPPSATGTAAQAALVGRGWTVTVDAGGVVSSAAAVGASATVTADVSTVAARVAAVGVGATVAAVHRVTTTAAATLGVGGTSTVGDGAGGPLWSDDFERPDATGIPAVGNGWTASVNAPTANIVSGDLVRPDTGNYRVLTNQAGGVLSADYRVTATFSGSSPGAYFGIGGRWAGATGVAVFFNANATTVWQLYVMEADSYLRNAVLVTPDDPFPASWTDTGVDHTFAVEFVGTTVSVYLDGVKVGHGTSTVNATATGTGVLWSGEGSNRHLRSISVT